MANPLTLLMPIIPGTDPSALAEALKGVIGEFTDGLTKIQTVHYARFVLLDRSSPNLQPTGSSDALVLAIITEYDGDFDHYVNAFAGQIGGAFDTMLQFVVGGAEIRPVKNKVDKFLAFIKANDASQYLPTNRGLFQAYTLTVPEILAAV